MGDHIKGRLIHLAKGLAGLVFLVVCAPILAQNADNASPAPTQNSINSSKTETGLGAVTATSTVTAGSVAGSVATPKHKSKTRTHKKEDQAIATPTPTSTTGSATSAPVTGQTSGMLPEVLVIGRSESLVGAVDSASEGYISQADLDLRPLLRPGETLETVPGLIVTQHSGDGKANQYFLRGFNLDHGTDFSTCVDGVPMNLPTQAHGQGYMDLNFMIPELIDSVEYKKGGYYADEGDFSSAGAAEIRTFRSLPQGIVDITLGDFGYQRAVLLNSTPIGPDHLLYAVETEHYDGPWDTPENYKKLNGFARYSSGTDDKGWDVTATAYGGNWNGTNQIPERAVADGSIDEFGTENPTDGGMESRYSLFGEWRDTVPSSATTLQAYVIKSHFDLFSDFTFYMNNPVQGDQFEQYDDRYIFGAKFTQKWTHQLLGADSDTTVGVQLRDDLIGEIGLFNTEERVRYSTDSDDKVNLANGDVYASNLTHWTHWFRTTLGLRCDAIDYDDTSAVPGDGGQTTGTLLSPKANLVFGPWGQTEFYLSGGFDYHSNDARGVNKPWLVNTVDGGPVTTANPDPSYEPLVQSRGAEFGVRCESIPHLKSTVAFWLLDLDSELVFDGDDGTTAPSGPTRRIGIEWGNDWRPLSWMTLDADLSTSSAYYVDDPAGANYVPEAAANVVSAGLAIRAPKDFEWSMRLRYFGPRYLVEDGSEQSQPTLLVNASAKYTRGNTSLELEAFNLFNAQADDITYYYATQLKGEAAPVNDFVFHPVEPLALRLSLRQDI